MRMESFITLYLLFLTLAVSINAMEANPSTTTAKMEVIDPSSLDGKIMCGYQGWFRCPGDASQLGWQHWSRNSAAITSESLSFDLWPDVREYASEDRFPAKGFSFPGGEQAYLYTADSADVILRHFTWMRDYGIDGVWMQHFLVTMPGGPANGEYASHMRVLENARIAAGKTGRVWAMSYDIAKMPVNKIYDILTADWKNLVNSGLIADKQYLHHHNKPVVQIWSFAYKNQSQQMTVELGNKLVDFFRQPGPYQAYLVGGVDWHWQSNPEIEWQRLYKRLDAITPWNVGNRWIDQSGASHASLKTWAKDKQACDANGILWIPVVYPGFSWDHLTEKKAGATIFPRRGGQFLWEQFHAASRLHAKAIFVAMFDEVDEGTAIYKVNSTPPVQTHFAGYEGLPSDWYLRLVGEATRLLKHNQLFPEEIPIKP